MVVYSEYMLWTDAASRDFIAKEYAWFLDTFDAYTYPIQRADAIRYFVLYHFGGVYLDLDVGCRRRVDKLLVYPVVLPKTIPVGVSNDLMFAEKGHPFMAQTIHNLVTFDHNWVLNYPTVMFSTGPMFLSAQYGFWTSSHAATPDMPGGEVRVLPKSLYGKNAKIEDVPHAFFSHFYGSSWHADDAAFIGFLGKWGKVLMWIGLALFIAGLAYLYWRRNKRSEGRLAGYEVLLPSMYQREGRWHIDVGPFTFTARGLSSNMSSSSSSPSTPDSEENVPMLPLSYDMRPPSPTPSETFGERRLGLVDTLFRYGSRIKTSITGNRERSRGRGSPRRRRGYLFFLPAIFTPSAVAMPEMGSRRPSLSRVPSYSSHSSHPPEKRYDDYEEADVYGASSGSSRPPTPGGSLGGAPPPPYHHQAGDASAAARRARSTDDSWEHWGSR